MKQDRVYMKEAAEKLILCCCVVREVKNNGDLECECGYCVNGECKLKNKDGFLPCNWEIC